MSQANANLCGLLQDRARERPSQAAIIDRVGASVTFAELDAATARGAALLASRGVRPGNRVLLLVPISIDLYSVVLSVMRLGATPVVLDPSAGLRHIRECCKIARPDAMIGVAKVQLLRIVCGAVRAIPRHFTIGVRWAPGIPWEDAKSSQPPPEITAVTEDAPALLTFTSGSTGRPKAVVRSHGLLRAQHEAVEHALHADPDAADLVTLPVFVLTNIASGITSVIADAALRRPDAIEPGPVLSQIRAHKVRSAVASPALLARLCEGEPPTLATLERIFTGGGPVFLHVLDEVARQAPDARIWALYGSTEAEPIAHVERRDITEADRQRVNDGGGLPAGWPVEQIALRVINDRWGVPLGPLSATEFERLVLPRREIGEIVVSGRHVLKGYLDGVGDEQIKCRVDSPDAATIWHRTGDAGYLDKEGRLWLVGRCVAKIVDHRGTIYPLQVEAAAHAYEKVARVALAGYAGQRLLLVEGGSMGVEERLMERLAWASIDRVVRVERIPMDKRHNSKVDYTTLAPIVRRLMRE